MTTRIHLIAGPRNVSTALMYSFAQRQDTTVVDEPLYAHYLSAAGVEHPGREEVLISQNANGEEVVKEVLFGVYDKENVFFKNMSHHLIDLDLSFLIELKNVFLIRDPYEVILSFSKVIASPSLRDIGIKKQYEIFSDLRTKDPTYIPIVLEGPSLLQNPSAMMKVLCAKLSIPFDERMLSWEKGGRPEDGVWAKYWYAALHQSTGFKPYKKREEKLTKRLMPLYEEAKPYFHKLQPYALKVDGLTENLKGIK